MQLTLYMAATDSIYGCNSLNISGCVPWAARGCHRTLALHFTVYMAATNSIYGCNGLYIWLQLTLYMAATHSIYQDVYHELQGVAIAHSLSILQSTWLQLTPYMVATDSIHGCKSISICMQLTLYMDATSSIYGCNSLYTSGRVS